MSEDWEINPDKYLKDENGEFLLKLDGTPRKKSLKIVSLLLF